MIEENDEYKTFLRLKRIPFNVLTQLIRKEHHWVGFISPQDWVEESVYHDKDLTPIFDQCGWDPDDFTRECERRHEAAGEDLMNRFHKQ